MKLFSGVIALNRTYRYVGIPVHDAKIDLMIGSNFYLEW